MDSTTGIIIGILMGSFFIIIGFCLCWWFFANKSRDKEFNEKVKGLGMFNAKKLAYQNVLVVTILMGLMLVICGLAIIIFTLGIALPWNPFGNPFENL